MVRKSFGRLAFLMAILLQAGPLLAQPYTVPMHAIAAGGAGASGGYVLEGTIGLVSAGNQLGGGPYTVIGGFWGAFALSLQFTDHPLVPGVTVVRALHYSELRSRIAALRSRFGLSGYSYSGAPVTAGIVIQAQHVLELRAAIAEVYAAAGLPPPAYSGSAPAIGASVRTTDIAELRAAVIAIE